MDQAIDNAQAGKKMHPKGLYLLFVTEMAERFSYYGMRALFMLYLVAAFFTNDMASKIYGSYTGLVYLTPLLGGYIADRFWGNRRSIIVGGLIMAVGQFLMFLSACFVKQSIFADKGPIDPSIDNGLSIIFLFSGIAALILGNGFFKPNISTMVGDLYEPTDSRKDAAFTIFYMGINVGAFIAPLICGTLGEGAWNDLAPFKWGFLCACIAMILSVVVFWALKDKYLVTPEGLGIGLPPSQSELRKRKEADATEQKAALAENIDNENEKAEAPKDAEANDKPIKAPAAKNSPLRLIGCIVGAIILFAVFSPLISLLTGSITEAAQAAGEAAKAAALKSGAAADAAAAAAETARLASEAAQLAINNWIDAAVFALAIALPVFIITDKTLTKDDKSRIGVIYIIAIFVIFFWSAFEQAGSSLTIFAKDQCDRTFGNWEMPTTWLQSVNPIVVVSFAPIMAMLWEKLGKKGREPHSVVKQALGLFLLSIGYFVIAFATHGVDPATKISVFWLIALYFIHTIGELSLSPIGLSMVNKLAPAQLASLLMGVWFMSNAASNILAGKLATLLPETAENGTVIAKSFLGIQIDTLDSFFMIFAIMSLAAAIILFALSPVLKKMMKGIN